MRRVIFLSVITGISLFGAAYKLPEVSLKGTALSAANVAACDGADCAYYNSANSAFLNSQSHYLEIGGVFVHLPSVKYKGMQSFNGGVTIPANGESKKENALLPYLHYVSKAYGSWRYGVSIVVPAGLVKRWESPIQKLYAQKFDLTTLLLNPSVTYKVNQNFAVSGGVDMLYSKGKVQNDGSLIKTPIKRVMDGDSIDYGFNLSASWHMENGVNIAATYRSKIKMSLDGDATLGLGPLNLDYKADVNIYLPAALTLAVSKEIDKYTLEFVYERTFWSSYKYLDFNYNKPLPPQLASFDVKVPKHWRDTNTLRVGLQYRYSDKLTLMAGYTYDQTPIKSSYLGYEMPDSDANIFSVGFNYQQSSKFAWGVGVLYDHKKKRTVKTVGGINGTFDKGGALLITTGFSYKF